MTGKLKYHFIALFITCVLTLNACGSAASNQSVIATSVAMTVQAQDTQAAQIAPSALPTASFATPLVTAPPLATQAPPTAPATGQASKFCTASASFVSETIPDGTIMDPGSVFTKVWRIKNTGTCPWDSTWKFVYMSGDVLGGAYVYNFPAPAAPGDTVDVPVVFTSPQGGGTYQGFWKIQSPWGAIFGDSGSGNAFWVKIVVGSGTPVNSKTETVYGVTDVSYPPTDRTCTTANTFYHYYASITSNGPVKVTYTWIQSDGHNYNNRKIEFTSASTITVSNDWSQGITSSTNPRWVQIIITSPAYSEWPKFTLPLLCNQIP